jgi:hypothetical protein
MLVFILALGSGLDRIKPTRQKTWFAHIIYRRPNGRANAVAAANRSRGNDLPEKNQIL